MMRLRVKTPRSAMALAAVPVGLCLTFCGMAALTASQAPAAPLTVRHWESWPGIAVNPQVVIAEQGLVETPSEMAEIAPDAFALDGNRVYLHDALHDAVRTYVSGRFVASASMPFVATQDMAVSGTTLAVLDNANTLHAYRIDSPAVRALGTSAVKASAKLTTLRTVGTGLTAQTDDGRSIAVNAQRTRFVGSLGAAPASGTTRETDGYSILSADGAITRIRLAHTPIGLDLLATSGGSNWYLAADWYSTEASGWIIERFVFQVADSGEVLNRYTLDPSATSVPARMVQVFNGGVYQLAIDGHTTRVLRLNPDAPAAAPRFSDAVVKEQGGTSGTIEAAKAKPKPATRYKIRVLQRAQALADFRWTYHAGKNGRRSVITGTVKRKGARIAVRNVVKQPHFLVAVSKKTVTGFPYTWGGFDADASSSAPKRWKNFTAGLKKGFYTGNISSASGGYAAGTVGLDCSGFISAVFGLKAKRGTGNLADGTYFRNSTAAPVAGDIFIHPGHVMLVANRYYAGNDLMIDVLESTTTKGADRVLANTYAAFKGLEGNYRTATYRNWSYKCMPGIPCPVSVDQ